MEVELKIEPGRPETKIVIVAGERTPELERLVRELGTLTLSPVQVWSGERSTMVAQRDFLRFYTEGKGVAAQTSEATYEVKLRIYELEELLDRRSFVRISNSEIINLDKVTAVDLSISGTICMTLEGTVKTYVSRRYVKKIKETLKGR